MKMMKMHPVDNPELEIVVKKSRFFLHFRSNTSNEVIFIARKDIMLIFHSTYS
eukprot:UN19322